MKLKELAEQIPEGKKKIFKQSIADSIGVNYSAVEHWFNGTRKPKGTNVIKLVPIISELMQEYNLNGKVTYGDIRPDLYPFV